MRSLLLAFALAACGSSSSPQPAAQPATPITTPPPGQPPPAQQTPSPTTPAADTSAPGIGQKCGSGDLCGPGTECVTYYGVAGAHGPQFKSCEIKCGAEKLCPNGTVCKTIADGPGQVCR